jgi:hypothetical protein
MPTITMPAPDVRRGIRSSQRPFLARLAVVMDGAPLLPSLRVSLSYAAAAHPAAALRQHSAPRGLVQAGGASAGTNTPRAPQIAGPIVSH